jgi:hypothetical protein
VWLCARPATLLTPEAAKTLTVPPLTSADVEAFVAEGLFRDPAELAALADDAVASAAAAGVALPGPPALGRRPPLPARAVDAADGPAVSRVERGALPFVESVEALQGAVAVTLDLTAAAVEKLLPAKPVE